MISSLLRISLPRKDVMAAQTRTTLSDGGSTGAEGLLDLPPAHLPATHSPASAQLRTSCVSGAQNWI